MRQSLQICREPALCGGVFGPAIREQVFSQLRVANFDLLAARRRQVQRLTQAVRLVDHFFRKRVRASGVSCGRLRKIDEWRVAHRIRTRPWMT